MTMWERLLRASLVLDIIVGSGAFLATLVHAPSWMIGTLFITVMVLILIGCASLVLEIVSS